MSAQKLREAAQQALTELRLCRSLLDDDQAPDHVAANQRAASAIRSLVDALAQPLPGADWGAEMRAKLDASLAQPTDDEIVATAIATASAEPGRDGYILPISFARAVLALRPAPQPLTDAAADQLIVEELGIFVDQDEMRSFLRAVERTQKIGGAA